VRQEIANLKKRIILEIAARHFDAHGFAATQINAIAKEAEVSIGTIYGLFESKEGLFQAHVLREMEKAVETMRTMIAQSDASPKEHLKAALTFYFTTIEMKMTSFQELLLSSPVRLGAQCHTDESRENGNVFLEIYHLFAVEFEKLDAITPLRHKDYLQHAINFRNVAAGYIERWVLLKDITLSQKIDECLELFLEGVIQ